MSPNCWPDSDSNNSSDGNKDGDPQDAGRPAKKRWAHHWEPSKILNPLVTSSSDSDNEQTSPVNEGEALLRTLKFVRKAQLRLSKENRRIKEEIQKKERRANVGTRWYNKVRNNQRWLCIVNNDNLSENTSNNVTVPTQCFPQKDTFMDGYTESTRRFVYKYIFWLSSLLIGTRLLSILPAYGDDGL